MTDQEAKQWAGYRDYIAEQPLAERLVQDCLTVKEIGRPSTIQYVVSE
jgi:hypothetical protein